MLLELEYKTKKYNNKNKYINTMYLEFKFNCIYK